MKTQSAQPTLNLLHTKRYVFFWISSLLSNTGTWMQQMAQPWVILSITKSAFWVGMDSFAMNSPAWVFTLWGGYLADRFDRKKIIFFCQIFQFICVSVLFSLLICGKIKVWIILVTSFLIGTTDSLSMPAFQSIIPSLVREADVPRAIALNSTQFSLSRIIGPALAGIVIASYGASVCYGANLVSYLPFFFSLYLIYPRDLLKTANQSVTLSSEPKVNQFSRILKEETFRTPLLTVLATNLFCSPLITFCPVIVKNIFHGGAKELGWSMAAFGLGGVVGGIAASFFNTKMNSRKGHANFIAAALGGVLVFVAGAHSFPLLCMLLGIGGVFLTTSNIVGNSTLQQSAKNTVRGQVVSLFQMALHSGISIGSLLTGAISERYGVQKAFFMNGIAAIVIQISILYFGNKTAKHPKE